jgi:single-stranded-DNA-specific exonuclease
VDCGSSSHSAALAAGKAGVDVIITDHHSIGANLPPALAVINPKRSDGPSGFENLAGVGVAFSLLICLRRHLREANFWHSRPVPNLKHYCDLVALGTVADMVPLVGDNRILARTGIEMMGSAPRPGIQSLMEMAGMRGRVLDAEDIAFRLAPRLNAAGRIKHADRAVELLTATDLRTARRLAEPLERLNTQRQILEKIILQQIEQRLAASPALLEKKSIVLSDSGWHLGVLGIVASRLMQRYCRPVVLITTQSGTGKGSARSIPGTDLYRLLKTVSDFLTSFGGHALAAGLEIDPANIDHFGQAFETAVRQATGDSAFTPVQDIDWQLGLDAISDPLIDELEQLKPFGAGNPEPIFLAAGLRVVGCRTVGKNHRKMTLQAASSGGARPIEAIWFNVDPSVPTFDHIQRLAFRLRWNRWNGRKTPQLVVEDVEIG